MVKICDFGLAHIRDFSNEGRATMRRKCGTKGYIAPEIGARESIVGPEIDVFALGVTLYEMITAYKPT